MGITDQGKKIENVDDLPDKYFDYIQIDSFREIEEKTKQRFLPNQFIKKP